MPPASAGEALRYHGSLEGARSANPGGIDPGSPIEHATERERENQFNELQRDWRQMNSPHWWGAPGAPTSPAIASSNMSRREGCGKGRIIV